MVGITTAKYPKQMSKALKRALSNKVNQLNEILAKVIEIGCR